MSKTNTIVSKKKLLHRGEAMQKILKKIVHGFIEEIHK